MENVVWSRWKRTCVTWKGDRPLSLALLLHVNTGAMCWSSRTVRKAGDTDVSPRVAICSCNCNCNNNGGKTLPSVYVTSIKKVIYYFREILPEWIKIDTITYTNYRHNLRKVLKKTVNKQHCITITLSKSITELSSWKFLTWRVGGDAFMQLSKRGWWKLFESIPPGSEKWDAWKQQLVSSRLCALGSIKWSDWDGTIGWNNSTVGQ